jgi:hypothetical protein
VPVIWRLRATLASHRLAERHMPISPPGPPRPARRRVSAHRGPAAGRRRPYLTTCRGWKRQGPAMRPRSEPYARRSTLGGLDSRPSR